MDKNEQLAWVWRSKVRCNPLFISTGHRVGMDSALMWVERCMRGYRLPGADALGRCGGVPSSVVCALASKSQLIQVHCA